MSMLLRITTLETVPPKPTTFSVSGILTIALQGVFSTMAIFHEVPNIKSIEQNMGGHRQPTLLLM